MWLRWISLAAQPNPTQTHWLKSMSVLHTKPALFKHCPKIFQQLDTPGYDIYHLCTNGLETVTQIKIVKLGETTRAWGTAPISLSRHRRLCNTLLSAQEGQGFRPDPGPTICAVLVNRSTWAMQQEVFFQLLWVGIVAPLLKRQTRKWVHKELCTLDRLSWVQKKKESTNNSQCTPESNKLQ